MSGENSEALNTYKNKFWFNKPSFFINCSAKDQVQLLNSLSEEEKSYLVDSMSKWERFYSLSSEMQKTIFKHMSPDAQYKILSVRYGKSLDITGHMNGFYNLSPEQRTDLYSELSGDQKEKLKNCLAHRWNLKAASFVSKQCFVWSTVYKITHKDCLELDGQGWRKSVLLSICCNEESQFLHKVGINTLLMVFAALCIISVAGVAVSGAALIAIAASLFLFEANIIFLRTFGGNAITRSSNFEKVVGCTENKKVPLIKLNELNEENDISTKISHDLDQSKISDKNNIPKLHQLKSGDKNNILRSTKVEEEAKNRQNVKED